MPTVTHYIPSEGDILHFNVNDYEYHERVLGDHGDYEAPGLICLDLPSFHDCKFGMLMRRMTLMLGTIKYFYHLANYEPETHTFNFIQVPQENY